MLALAATVLLYARSRYEWHPAGMGYVTPSLALEGILNFPTIVLHGLLCLWRLTDDLPPTLGFVAAYGIKVVEVVAFWFWLGWIVDTRKIPKTRMRRVQWTCAYAILVGICGWIIWATWFGHGHDVVGLVLYLIRDGGNWLWSWSLDTSLGSFWFVGGAIYFGKKGLRMWWPSSDELSTGRPNH